MNKAMACFLISLGILSAGGSALADTRAVVESTRIYMDQETKVTLEYWIARDRSLRTSPGRATITRDDLGLVWNLDLNAKSYTESVLRKPASPPPRPKPDMRKLWQDFYEPDYSWTIKDTGARKTVNGFDCREFRAAGEADFAEISASYWICLTPGLPGGKTFHDHFLGQYRGDSRLAALLKLLEENPGSLCAYREEAVENSIAPAVRSHTELKKLEEAEAPPGTYEIPAGFRKVEARGDR
ncbi:MAG: hypothetical protein A2W03_06585 [Candidatus Aminicenantes bacterium RBG_16_63_16]|nr:MAG: hypothetical protein A2W03_06585 [Candidatus Aminicenantes bacterium RBG_16_63_16]